MPQLQTLDIGQPVQNYLASKRQKQKDMIENALFVNQLANSNMSRTSQARQNIQAYTQQLLSGLDPVDPDFDNKKFKIADLVGNYAHQLGIPANEISSGAEMFIKSYTPEAAKAFRIKQGLAMAPKTGTMDTGGQIIPYSQNALSGELTQGIPTNKTVTPGQILSSQTSIRGQDIAAQTARRGQDISSQTSIRGQNISADTARRGQDLSYSQSKIPSGYRMTPTGNLEQIPGGPPDIKQYQRYSQDTAIYNNTIADLDRLAALANEIYNAPGLAGITGIKGAFPNIPGGAAADAQSKFNTFKSQIAFATLQNLKNNSKTGGALGQVSDKEEKMLSENLASLDKAQSYDAMRASLKNIMNYTEKAKGRINQAYTMQYGNNGAYGGTGNSRQNSQNTIQPQSNTIEQMNNTTPSNNSKSKFSHLWE